VGPVQVSYGGQLYTIVGRDIEDVESEVLGILASGQPGWLEAVDGDPRAPHRLLITPGVPLTLAALPTG